jgi:hypothetical protein
MGAGPRGERLYLQHPQTIAWAQMKEVLVLIPARGGSKGIPRKNIRAFAGHPLIAYSIAAGLQSQAGRVLVSTDDEEIAAVADLWCGALCDPRASDTSIFLLLNTRSPGCEQTRAMSQTSSSSFALLRPYVRRAWWIVPCRSCWIMRMRKACAESCRRDRIHTRCGGSLVKTA